MNISKSMSIRLMTGMMIATSTTAYAAEPTIQLGVGLDYSIGDYGGTEDTTIYEVPFTARMKTGNWSLRARIPYVSIDGPGGIIPGENDARTLSVGADTINESGLGDISLAATYSHKLSDEAYLDMTGQFKLPTGDEDKDLGIGETDFGLSAELGRSGDGGGIYAMGGYKIRGGDFRDDGVQAAIGGYRRLSTTVTAGAEVNWSQSAYDMVDDAVLLTGFTSLRISEDFSLSLYAETGLTDNAPDFGAGVGLTWRRGTRRPRQNG